MNKLNFMITDCANEIAYYYLRSVKGGYNVPDYTKDKFVKDVTDLICERKHCGVRFLGKDEIARRVTEYVEQHMSKFLTMLNK